MKFERSAGILLHPSSLPGPYGIGDIGPSAHKWLDFLAAAGCKLWQILPLGPTGYGDSPYQCFSAFAGNPYLISPDLLHEDGLLLDDELEEVPSFPDGKVDFGAVIPWKVGLLNLAFERFERSGSPALKAAYDTFSHQERAWLDDFALFMALKEQHGGGSWTSWDPPLRDRHPKPLREASHSFAEAINRQIFRQFIFFRQWAALRARASEAGIRIIGDIPIFVAHDSSDVWAHPELFHLDQVGMPRVVAGVPPDYFSETGQLWGNPLYRWKDHRSLGYAWWIERFRSVLNLVDIVRLDHFRGFEGYWEVSGRAKTAVKGRWVKGPGANFFHALHRALGELPIIAEDLGVITPEVVRLREQFNLPGMKVLQFAFAGGPKDPFLPHNYEKDYVIYTGTHDNDTSLGWYERVEEDERSFYRRYLASDGRQVSWDLIRACWASVGVFALAPMQDFLSLDNSARMNYPGNPSGNWTWRLSNEDAYPGLIDRIKEINYLYLRG